MEKCISIIMKLLPVGFVVVAFVLAYLAIPKIVKYATKKKLFDMPDERKEHTNPIPALGGISIMAGMIPSLLFLLIHNPSLESGVFVIGIMVLFSTGVVDDIVLLSATKRLFIQLAVASCVVFSGVRFPHLFGILGLYELPGFLLIILNIIIVTGIINAFNLIDGINGLAGGLGCISIFVLGILLYINNNLEYSIVAFSAAIAYLAFLRYNLKPTFIFMGDNGSLVLGYLIAFFSLKLLQNVPLENSQASGVTLKIILALSSIPVIDALRVFAGRIAKKRSPFSADRTHIHHFFIQKGFTHHRSSQILYAVHITLIVLAILNTSSIEVALLFNISIVSSLTLWLTREKKSIKKTERESIIVKSR